MFTPGLMIKTALLAIWSRIRENPQVISGLKGVECGAVGLVFNAIYRLWLIGFMDKNSLKGSPLDYQPWFVLITVTAFVISKWFGAKPVVAIITGAVLGMMWFGVVRPE